MRDRFTTGLLATSMGIGLLAVGTPRAHASSQGRKNTAIGLGALAVYELLRGKTTTGVIAGAGAAYAYKEYKDSRDAELRYDRSDQYDSRPRYTADSADEELPLQCEEERENDYYLTPVADNGNSIDFQFPTEPNGNENRPSRRGQWQSNGKSGGKSGSKSGQGQWQYGDSQSQRGQWQSGGKSGSKSSGKSGQWQYGGDQSQRGQGQYDTYQGQSSRRRSRGSYSPYRDDRSGGYDTGTYRRGRRSQYQDEADYRPRRRSGASRNGRSSGEYQYLPSPSR